jgi:hypothetical protein
MTKSRDDIIGISEFVKRQTVDSQFTHYEGSWMDLANTTEDSFKNGNYEKGYRDGVFVVHIDKKELNLFYTYNDFPMFDGMKLEAKWEKTKGREHEPSKLQIKILEPKQKCNYVDIIIYRKEVLLEDKDSISGAYFDIVSINGRLNKEAPPIDPLTLVRNWLHLPGGTEMKDTKPEQMLDMLCNSVLHQNGIKYEKNIK